MDNLKGMRKISITKYDLAYRDEKGVYQKNEWTSISDIGKIYDNQLFTYNDYCHIETLYVEAVNLIMSNFDTNHIKINHIFKFEPQAEFEKYNGLNLYDTYNLVKKGSIIKEPKIIEDLVRLRLREHIAELEICIDKSSKTEILFGFDYYMYLKTNKDISDLSVKIQDLGLFLF